MSAHSVMMRVRIRELFLRRRVPFFAALLLCTAGCSTAKINAGFPEVPLQAAGNSGVKIGVARAEDSRATRIAGTWTVNFREVDFLVGPELPDYIERKFRNGLVQRGFAPVDALDPAKSTNAQDYKTLVLTLQSVTFSPGYALVGLSREDASVTIAVQVYAPSGSREIYAGSFSGAGQARLGSPFTGVHMGSVIAVAADHAIDAAFADSNFEQALK
jgi:hypothetical protein